MKKIASVILSTVIVASVIAGCNSQPATSESSVVASVAASDPAAATDVQATDVQAADVQDEDIPRSLDELYGPQLSNYLNHQYYFEGEPIPITESNFFFILTFGELYNYSSMGYYPATTLGFLDLSATFPGDTYDTYGDFFVEKAEYNLQSACIFNKYAEENGLTLSENEKNYVDGALENIQATAEMTGLTPAQVIEMQYGPGCDEATFKKLIEKYIIYMSSYPEYYYRNFDFNDYALSITNDLPYVRYACFYVEEGSAQEIYDEALAAATAMKDACTTVDDINTLAASDTYKAYVREFADITVPEGKYVPEFEEWANDPARVAGDIDVISSSRYGYFVMGFLDNKPRYHVPAVRYAIFYAPAEAEQADKDNALAAATAMKDACTSLDDLTTLSVSGQESGSVYDYGNKIVPKGMNYAFEDWAYEDGRAEGDIDIIYRDEVGYIVVGYLGTDEMDEDTLYSIATDKMTKALDEDIKSGSHEFHTDDVFLPAPAAPTPTEIPEGAVVSGDGSSSFDPFPSSATNEIAGQGDSSMKTADVLIVVFITLAAVAVLAVIVILVGYAMKNKNGAVSKTSSDDEEDDEDSDEDSDSDSDEDSDKDSDKDSDDEDEDDESSDEESEDEE